MVKIIDSHAHMDFPDFAGKEEEVISRAKEAGVFKIINVGVDLERSKKSIELAKKFKGTVFATVGLHPHEALEVKRNELREIRELAESPGVIAIGECGLDFYRVNSEDEKERQIQLFRSQIDLANELELPLVIHSREAEKETLEILREYKGKAKGGVVHCFTGSLDFARELIGLGYYIGFTGIITFDKTGELEKVIKEVPLDKVLVETDAPFLAPIPYRGKTNEPAYVVEVASKIARLKGVEFNEVAKQTTANAENLFRI